MEISATSSSATTPPADLVLKNRDDGLAELPREHAMWASFPMFMSSLVDDTGTKLTVALHHEHWCRLMETESKLVLLAPRDHGKTWTQICYLMWNLWRHNRKPTGEWDETNPDGGFEMVLFSDTYSQAGEFFEKLQMLVLANEELFADILPVAGGKKLSTKSVWTGGRIRMRNLAQVTTKAFGTSTRGLHPDLLILDDVLNDQNSATKYQRDKVWKYFVGTISPMLSGDGQMIVIGTAQHYNDLLHRLKDAKNPDGTPQFRFVKMRAVHWESERALWPARHDLQDLRERRSLDVVLFSKEYQNDPRDDASSLFPFSLTQPAIEKGRALGFLSSYQKMKDELVVLSADMALSEAVGADYCVVNVAKVDYTTQQRTLLWAQRGKGWSFQQQVDILRLACQRFQVDFGVIENNSFQRWVRQETEKYPETAGKIVGHQTGVEKTSLQDGVPGLVIALHQKLWSIPSGIGLQGELLDEEAREYAAIWASELNAFGWVNDKLQGAGEHDDTVMAFWLLERAIRIMNTLLAKGPPEQFVTLSEVGMERVTIGDWG